MKTKSLVIALLLAASITLLATALYDGSWKTNLIAKLETRAQK